MLPAYYPRPLSPQRAPPANYPVEREEEKVERDLWTIAMGNAKTLSYEGAYRTQYNLVVHGRGWFVYNRIHELLRRMSLCMALEAYWAAFRIIHDISLHLDNRWCAVKRVPSLVDLAMHAFNRDVARRWRKVIAVLRWGAKIRLWRAAFTEVWLRPGGLGERALSKRFDENKRVLTHQVVSH